MQQKVVTKTTQQAHDNSTGSGCLSLEELARRLEPSEGFFEKLVVRIVDGWRYVIGHTFQAL